MRSRAGALPELELIALDEEDPSPAARTVELKSTRWWPVALVAVVVAGAIVATGQGVGLDHRDGDHRPPAAEHALPRQRRPVCPPLRRSGRRRSGVRTPRC